MPHSHYLHAPHHPHGFIKQERSLESPFEAPPPPPGPSPQVVSHNQRVQMQFEMQRQRHLDRRMEPLPYFSYEHHDYLMPFVAPAPAPSVPPPQTAPHLRAAAPPPRARTPENAAAAAAAAGTPGSRKRHRRTESSDDLDIELKNLAFRASEVPLSELALRIRASENDDAAEGSPRALAATPRERQRQIFAMVWLLGSCESSATAVVPRNRIYARYVQICADNSLMPLSPASFGKLVRILFPNLTTRRLGMRGQSKYHYCGIKLVGDNSFHELSSPSSSHGVDSPQSGFDTPFGGSPAATPPASGPAPSAPPASAAAPAPAPVLRYVPNLFDLIEQSLAHDAAAAGGAALTLPSIYPFLPADCDYDIADTLYSLYRVHCTTVFDALRYMHLTKLFGAFANFAGVLTAPVLKLYVSAPVHEWVRQCDEVTYRAMTKMLTKLHLQDVPEDVVQNLKVVASQYEPKLAVALTKVPRALAHLKSAEARRFVGGLARLVRVIETGHSATRILNNPAEKHAMLADWRRLDVAELALRDAPCSPANRQALLAALQHEVVPALAQILGATAGAAAGAEPPPLAVMAALLARLPSRFDRVNARLYILVACNLITTFLREISLAGGQGFGAWWVVRCWIDEFLNWYFELGGLLYDELSGAPPPPPPPAASAPPPPDDPDPHRTLVDLLDDSYGFPKDQDSAEGILDYHGVEDILGRDMG
ncbi:RFX-type winged-helix domain-containing protein [[Candida] zeylanoides]